MGLKESRWSAGRDANTLRSWPQSAVSNLEPRPVLQPTSIKNAAITITTESSRGSSPARELDRYLKLVARLKWKLPFLAQGYNIATNRVGVQSDIVAANELHFKIDFYEYYMHIERALVHLMGVFGIKVTGLGDSVHNPSNGDGKPSDRGIRMGVPQSSHRYHANVLAALEKPDNPLHEILGQGEVRKQLARAKELRNRWKNADAAAAAAGNDGKGYAPAPLEAYNLEKILEAIFAGFDQAYVVAELYIRDIRGSGDSSASSSMEPDKEEDDWGFIADAMDWEAV